MNQKLHDPVLDAAQAELFAAHSGTRDASAVFIVGAPRTGSTLFYQALAQAFDLPFVSNTADADTPHHPAIGVLRSFRANQDGLPESGFESCFGKTRGLHAPSEGSAVFSHWCGGGHPSERVSPGILPDREAHMRATLSAIESATGAPLLIKNAWNCFRVPALARAFPRAVFLWIRRDAADAAASDLAARYAVQGDPQAWNSATPHNVELLRRLHPAGQVLENQFEFSRAISEAAAALPDTRFSAVWYEDFLADPNAV
ncbi:MAG: sulfotransferase, partial [Alphaproteobacteria bacterium]|nr:sulfotransferase [Alphaproteobacteria bacterium]